MRNDNQRSQETPLANPPYAAWRVNDSWKVGGDPESIPEIERELKLASKKLNAFIRSLTRAEQS